MTSIANKCILVGVPFMESSYYSGRRLQQCRIASISGFLGSLVLEDSGSSFWRTAGRVMVCRSHSPTGRHDKIDQKFYRVSPSPSTTIMTPSSETPGFRSPTRQIEQAATSTSKVGLFTGTAANLNAEIEHYTGLLVSENHFSPRSSAMLSSLVYWN